MRLDEYGALENSTDVINLLVDNINISMETTCGDASWINGKNKQHNRIIHNMIKVGLIGGNQHKNTWFCASETSAEVYMKYP